MRIHRHKQRASHVRQGDRPDEPEYHRAEGTASHARTLRLSCIWAPGPAATAGPLGVAGGLRKIGGALRALVRRAFRWPWSTDEPASLSPRVRTGWLTASGGGWVTYELINPAWRPLPETPAISFAEPTPSPAAPAPAQVKQVRLAICDEQTPCPGEALQFMLAPVAELDARAHDQVGDSAGHQYLTRLGH